MDFNNYTRDELKAYIKKSAKKANSRLKRLEDTGRSKASNAYQHFRADKFYNKVYLTKSKDNKLRFRESGEKLTMGQLKQTASEISKFLEAKTSSVTGVKNKYKKSYQTFMQSEKGRELNMTFEEYSEFWAAENVRKLVDMYGSDVLVQIRDRTDEDFRLRMQTIRNVNLENPNKPYYETLYELEQDPFEVQSSIFD